jgi:drug/metabolite transporter (DMT)-like permease
MISIKLFPILRFLAPFAAGYFAHVLRLRFRERWPAALVGVLGLVLFIWFGHLR